MILFFSKKKNIVALSTTLWFATISSPLARSFVFSLVSFENKESRIVRLIHKRQQSRSWAAFFKATLYLLYPHSNMDQKTIWIGSFLIYDVNLNLFFFTAQNITNKFIQKYLWIFISNITINIIIYILI